MQDDRTPKAIRKLLLLFILCLFLSGLTAIPVDLQLGILVKSVQQDTTLHAWLQKVLFAYREVAREYPFLFYGYDWLAFAHFIFAILFLGPYRDPVKNIWVIGFGMIACVLVPPFAFVAGSFRGIPLGWRLIDCSFGVFGFLLLRIVYTKTKSLINEYTQNGNSCSNRLVAQQTAG